MPTALPANAEAFLHDITSALEAHDRFDRATRHGARVEAHATATPDEALFCVEIDDEGVWLAWASEDRYLSQSIEAELVFTGDDLDDMIDEEIVDAGWDLGKLAPNAHFRDDERRFVFRCKAPVDAETLDPKTHAPAFASALAGMVEAFAELGDMQPDDDD